MNCSLAVTNSSPVGLERFSLDCRKTKTKSNHNGQLEQTKVSEGANEKSK